MSTDHNILIAGFLGRNNSANILLNHLRRQDVDLLYLRNSFTTCANQITNQLSQNYQYALIFGQRPRTQKIFLETTARRKTRKLSTDFDYSSLKSFLEQANYGVSSSTNAGRYLCNYVFYQALSYKAAHNLDTKIAFIHIPSKKNIHSFPALAQSILNYLDTIN